MLAWVLVGAGYAFGVLSLLSIGILVVAIALVATVFLARRPDTLEGLPGLVEGLSLPLFYLAFLNRSGPGTVCTTTAASESCVEESSPWPWVVIGVALLVSGCVWFVMANRRRRSVRTSS